MDLREKLADANELEDYEKVVTELNERLRKAAKVGISLMVVVKEEEEERVLGEVLVWLGREGGQ